MDPFADDEPRPQGGVSHPLFKKCEECKEYLVWRVWTSVNGNKCRAWCCPTRSKGHTTEFV